MSKRFILRTFFIFIALVLLLPAAWTITARQAHATTGVPYYVDNNPNDGNDSCNGRYPYKIDSTNCPWASVAKVNGYPFTVGDSVAFEEGETWTDSAAPQISFLHPSVAGSASGVITITSYCDTQHEPQDCNTRPVLAGNGDTETVYLANQQGWTIENLEITNYPPNQQCKPPFFGQNQNCVYGIRRGIYVYALDPGLPNQTTYLNNITLSNLDVQDVLGQYGKDQNNDPPQYDAFEITGGIVFDIEKSSSTDQNFTAWNTVSVTDNTVYDVLRNGILFHSAWIGDAYSLPQPRNCAQFSKVNVAPGTPNRPSLFVDVEHNRVHYLGGNGIVVGVSLQPKLQNNTAYDGDEDKAGGAGIWTFDSNGSTIAHNLVYNWRFYNSSGKAGDAYDTDLCDYAATFEYNFAYGGDSNPDQGGNSDGAFLQAMPQSSATVVRYNVSQNDGSFGRWFLDNQGSGQQTGACGAKFYDNDIYMSQASDTVMFHTNDSCSTSTLFENNIIENTGTGNCTLIAAWTVNYNDYYGGITNTACNPPSPTLNNVSGDPKFTTAGGADSTTCIPIDAPPTAPSCPAYVLQSGSVAYCLGTQIPDNGTVDFDQVALPPPNAPQNNPVDAGALEKGADIC